MLKSGINIKKWTFLLPLIVLTMACRKKVEHEPGMSVFDDGEYWEWVDIGSISNVTCMEVFNGRLYAFGAKQNNGLMVRIDPDGLVHEVRTMAQITNLEYPVRDMEVVGNYLYAGGSFISNDLSGIASGLFRMSANESFEGIQFTSEDVNVLKEYQGALIVGGDFNISPNGAQSVDIDQVVETTAMGFGGGLTGTRYGITEHDGVLYSCGSGNKLLKRQSSSWVNVSTPNCQKLYSVTSYNGELYIMGDFMGSSSDYPVRKRNISGEWEIITTLVHDLSMGTNYKFRIANGKLFIVCERINIGTKTYQLLELDDTTWKGRNGFYGQCKDLVFYEGYYYVCTQYGIFRQKE